MKTRQQLQIALNEMTLKFTAEYAKATKLNASWERCMKSLGDCQSERDELYKCRDNALREAAFYKRMADYLIEVKSKP